MFEFNGLVPDLQGAAYDLFIAASNARLLPRLTSGRRTAIQQLRLYKAYLQGRSVFPALPPGLSGHEYGFAFDMVVEPFDALGDVGYTWIQWGGAWGGNADPVHFELPDTRDRVLAAATKQTLAMGIDFAISFLPVVGEASTVASLLQLYPPWSHNAVLNAISSPVGTLLGTQ